MQGCIAPSEIPGIDDREGSVFGRFAEDLVYADFCLQQRPGAGELFRDHHNPSAYLFFLARHNPQFTPAAQADYFGRTRAADLRRIPDFLLHKADERVFYEVKPDSGRGRADGVQKVGILGAVYREFDLPYRGGTSFHPRDHLVARFGNALKVTLRARRAAPGLIVYQLCLDANGTLELATLAVLLAHIVRELNKQHRRPSFRPLDLEESFRRHRDLGAIAAALGLSAALLSSRVRWRMFWRAVVRRFAVRGAAAGTLAAADGPLPVGDLLAAGIAIWAVIDIVRLSDELWSEADAMAGA